MSDEEMYDQSLRLNIKAAPMTVEEMKAKIDRMSYCELLERRRFNLPGDIFFQTDEMRIYYDAILAWKRQEIGTEEAARINREIDRKKRYRF